MLTDVAADFRSHSEVEPHAEPTTRGSSRWPVYVLIVLLLALVLTWAGWLGTGGRLFWVGSPSMGMIAPVGSLVATEPIPVGQPLHVGELIVFQSTPGPSTEYIHPVYRILPGGRYMTKGVLNNLPDTWTITRNEIVGRPAVIIPAIGWIYKMATWLFFGLAIMIALSLFLSSRGRRRVLVLGPALIVGVPLLRYRPLIGGYLYSIVKVKDRIVAQMVDTGILPVHFQLPGSKSVYAAPGQEVVVSEQIGQGNVLAHIKTSAALPWWGWGVIVMFCMVPLFLFGWHARRVPLPLSDDTSVEDADDVEADPLPGLPCVEDAPTELVNIVASLPDIASELADDTPRVAVAQHHDHEAGIDLQTLLSALRQVSTNGDLGDVLQSVAFAARSVVATTSDTRVVMWLSEGSMLRAQYDSTPGRGHDTDLSPIDFRYGRMGEATQSGRTVVEPSGVVADRAGEHLNRLSVAVPMLFGEQPVGVIDITTPGAEPPVEDTIKVLEMLATFAAAIILAVGLRHEAESLRLTYVQMSPAGQLEPESFIDSGPPLVESPNTAVSGSEEDLEGIVVPPVVAGPAVLPAPARSPSPTPIDDETVVEPLPDRIDTSGVTDDPLESDVLSPTVVLGGAGETVASVPVPEPGPSRTELPVPTSSIEGEPRSTSDPALSEVERVEDIAPETFSLRVRPVVRQAKRVRPIPAVIPPGSTDVAATTDIPSNDLPRADVADTTDIPSNDLPRADVESLHVGAAERTTATEALIKKAAITKVAAKRSAATPQRRAPAKTDRSAGSGRVHDDTPPGQPKSVPETGSIPMSKDIDLPTPSRSPQRTSQRPRPGPKVVKATLMTSTRQASPKSASPRPRPGPKVVKATLMTSTRQASPKSASQRPRPGPKVVKESPITSVRLHKH